MDKSPQHIGTVVGVFLMGLLVAALFLIITAPRFFPHSWENRPPSFAAVVQKSLNSVVSIGVQANPSELPLTVQESAAGKERVWGDAPERTAARLTAERQRQNIVGSGLIISTNGHILTNAHVLEQAPQPVITTFAGKQFLGQIVGRDIDTDLALIKITSDSPLPSAVFGDSDAVQVGDWAIAIGNPLGFEHSCSAGVISAKGRTLGRGLYDDFLQTDAFMHKGSSGGPLLDVDGRVIGISTALLKDAEEVRGVHFAIPSNLAKNIAADLLAKGRVVRGWLGVAVGDIVKSASSPLAPQGVLVTEVFAGGPAAAAGIRAGDLIMGTGNKTFHSSRELLLFIASWEVDKMLPISIIREGQPLVVEVLVREKTTSPAAPIRHGAPAKTHLLPANKKLQAGAGKRKNTKITTACIFSPSRNAPFSSGFAHRL